MQFRISATARVERDTPLADEQWERSALSSRRCYLAPRTPGEACDAMESNIPPQMAGRQPTREESEAGRANFAVVVTTALRADVLELAAEGHRRVMLTFGGDAKWVAV
jgi:pyridoxamine 5'-phosphate oxidase